MRLLSRDGNFNSIKVQLKHRLRRDKLPARSFQFHKGTIKAGYEDEQLVGELHFNSIKVQLKPKRYYVKRYREVHFNSIKVQLKRRSACPPRQAPPDFNSIKVQLKPAATLESVLIR